jgi:magnesium transporter
MIQPTSEEVRGVMTEFGINPLVADELTSPSYKSRVELYRNYIYLILHFPAFKHSHKKEDAKQEVDFIIGKNFLITARYDTIDAIEKFSKIVEVNTILDRGLGENHTGFIFFGILKEIYQSLQNELEYVENWLSQIEEDIFAGKEKEMVVSLSQASRILLNFKKSTDFHKEALNSLDVLGKKIFDEHFSYHVNRVLDEYQKVIHSIRNNTDSVTELRETNNSLLTTKQNEVMKVLTIVAFIALPLTIIASILQVDFVSRPIVGHPNDFWITVLVFVALGILMYAYFRYKKWL